MLFRSKMKKVAFSSRGALAAALVALPRAAMAYGGGPLVSFAQSLLTFLTATLGPIVFGLGLAVAAYGFFVGHREALQRGIYVIIGGALLFSIPSVIDFVAQTSH